MLDRLSLPCVSDVNFAATGLNDGRVGVLSSVFLFQGQDSLPLLSIFRKSDSKFLSPGPRLCRNLQCLQSELSNLRVR